MFVLGVRWAIERLLRSLPLVAWILFLLLVTATALVERRAASLVAAEHVLLGAVSGLTIPLLVYCGVALVFTRSRGAVADPECPMPAAVTWARYGGDRRLWMLGAIVGSGMLLALSCAVLAGVALVVAGGSLATPLLTDVRNTAVVAALGAAAYAAFFAFGSTVKGAWLRPVLLVADWVLGSLTTAVALPLPRGHVRALLGAEPVIGLSQTASWAVLWGLVIAYTAVALLRTPR